MKNIYIIIISLFGLTLISCAKINSAMDDVNKKYDEFSKESDEPEKTSASTEKASIEKGSSFGFLFVSVGEKGTILTSPKGNKWTKRTSGSKSKLRAVAYGKDKLVVVGFSGTILTSSDGIKWTKSKSGTKKNLGSVT